MTVYNPRNKQKQPRNAMYKWLQKQMLDRAFEKPWHILRRPWKSLKQHCDPEESSGKKRIIWMESWLRLTGVKKKNSSLQTNRNITKGICLLIVTVVTDIMFCTLSACFMWPELAKETLHPHFPRQGWVECFPTHKTFFILLLGSGGCSVFDSEEPFLWSGQFLLYPFILLLLQNCPHRRVREDRRWPATFKVRKIVVNICINLQAVIAHPLSTW